jgi:hypothetical protein
MQHGNANKFASQLAELNRAGVAGMPSNVERAFACQLATSVWLRQLGEADAGEAVSAYVRARFRSRMAQGCLRAALEHEYRLCRERLELCS